VEKVTTLQQIKKAILRTSSEEAKQIAELADTVVKALEGAPFAPQANPVFTESISMGRREESRVGYYSVAEGESCEASGIYSHAEGCWCCALGENSHVEGSGCNTGGDCSHAEGMRAYANGDYSHAEGRDCAAYSPCSHAEGDNCVTYGDCSHAEGDHTIARNYASHAGGKYNKRMTEGSDEFNTAGDVMVIGNGIPYGDRSNCFRVTYAGEVYGLSAFNATGADYAEYFEWADGNPDKQDRVGHFVTLDEEYIRIANPGDYILGVVSGQPCIIGNADEDWLGRWEHDEFGRFVLEYLEDEETEIPTGGLSEDEISTLRREPDVKEKNGKLYRVTAKVVDHETPSWRHKANPDYDSSQPYVERKDRPEWSAVGMLGVLSVRDDGSCIVNGYCKVTEGGIATAADAELAIEDGKIVKGYRVLERVSDNVVKVVFR